VSRIRVLLAEDHETVRHGLRLLIDGQSDMEVIGEAGDGRTAVDRVRSLRPNVAIVDVSMPHLNGLDATREIKRVAPETAVVALTRYGDSAYVQELVRAGVHGYILKQSASGELLQAIRAAAGGRVYLDPALGDGPLGNRRRRGEAPPPITDRETEVLRLMSLGHSNKEIAATLAISVKTVEVHKANGMRKLGLQGRTDIVKYALLKGWLTEP
jgi:DNA-binding NarL/FixJ family response regulator